MFKMSYQKNIHGPFPNMLSGEGPYIFRRKNMPVPEASLSVNYMLKERQAIAIAMTKNRYGMDFCTIMNDFFAILGTCIDLFAINREEELYFAVREQRRQRGNVFIPMAEFQWHTGLKLSVISKIAQGMVRKGVFETSSSNGYVKRIKLKKFYSSEDDPVLGPMYENFLERTADLRDEEKERYEETLRKLYEAVEMRKCDLSLFELLIYTEVFFTMMYKTSRASSMSPRTFLLLLYITLFPGRMINDYRAIMPYMSPPSFYSSRTSLMPDFLSLINEEGGKKNRQKHQYCTTELSAEIVYLSIMSLNKWVDEQMMRIPPRGNEIVIRERSKENEQEIISALKGIAECGERVIKESR